MFVIHMQSKSKWNIRENPWRQTRTGKDWRISLLVFMLCTGVTYLSNITSWICTIFGWDKLRKLDTSRICTISSQEENLRFICLIATYNITHSDGGGE